MKKYLPIVFLAILILSISALASNGTGSQKGSSAPTSSTTLPYHASAGNFTTSTYTKYYFKPSGTDIDLDFSAYCYNQVNYTLSLYSLSTGTQVPVTLVFIPGTSGNVSTSHSWTGLSSTAYYYGRIQKTDSSVTAGFNGYYY